MIRGIELVSNAHIGVLEHIFKGVDLSQYIWTSENYMAYSSMTEAGNDVRFSAKLIKGEDFQEYIYSEPEFSIDFAELKGFSDTGKISEINTYEDYLNSDCQIMILINDMFFLEVYVKDVILLERLYTNALQFGEYKVLEYKTDENDCRTKMHVW